MSQVLPETGEYSLNVPPRSLVDQIACVSTGDFVLLRGWLDYQPKAQGSGCNNQYNLHNIVRLTSGGRFLQLEVIVGDYITQDDLSTRREARLVTLSERDEPLHIVGYWTQRPAAWEVSRCILAQLEHRTDLTQHEKMSIISKPTFCNHIF